MAVYKKGKIVKGKVSGITDYGIFVKLDDEYSGLIHISEISYGFVKNINDFINVGDNIYAEVVNVDNNNKQIKSVHRTLPHLKCQIQSLETSI